MFLGILLLMLGFLESLTATQTVIFILIAYVFWTLGPIFLLNGIHTVYELPKKWAYRMLTVYALLVIPFLFLFRDWGGTFSFFFGLAVDIEVLRLNLQAIRRRRPGAWILFTSFIVQILLTTCMIGFYLAGRIDLYLILVACVFANPAIGLSLFTASEFARNGLALQKRVIEVEQLSKKTIVQEKEKQQILSLQNETLERQVTERTAALSQSLKELKETQVQLVQREKMASLGELTAGIAHEIQNPLNFVNNFSEVNKELIREVKNELSSGNLEEALAIADDIEQNEQVINHHGRRAEAIVKGMLQHSRSSTGQREPTDINALADEYLHLSYLGQKAKYKEFSATIQTDFDDTVGKIKIVPQDIASVLLNLYNNAFYAMLQKRRQLNVTYEPVISVRTRKVNDSVIISVRDNGTGIPQKVLHKIYQPFFTTKPAGEGTGLGLSLSYDIVTKTHGGELKVNTKDGEFCEFEVVLPV
ncbi:MAG: GHKL domain-containing protein [Flavisolibacter sp.]|nr:GHKL domain-containing protein [Flavisolibacter sp.]